MYRAESRHGFIAVGLEHRPLSKYIVSCRSVEDGEELVETNIPKALLFLFLFRTSALALVVCRFPSSDGHLVYVGPKWVGVRRP